MDTIIEMGLGQFYESRWKHLIPSTARWRQHMEFCLARGFLMVHEYQGKVDGYMAGIVGPMMFSDSLQLLELTLYVVPEKRNGRIAIELIKAFEQYGRDNGVVECFAGSSAGIKVEGVRRIYEHCGWQYVGDLMVRSL